MYLVLNNRHKFQTQIVSRTLQLYDKESEFYFQQNDPTPQFYSYTGLNISTRD